MKNILIFIGARGGSKGVKGKNIRSLAGKPLIVHTIKQALKWGKAKRVVVSTDSPNIAKIAKQAGALVPFLRPAQLASDKAPKLLAVKHCLAECEKLLDDNYDIVVDLDATAPIRSIKDLDACLRLFLKYKPTTLFSVVSAHKNPYFNMVEEKKDGRIELCKKLPGRIVRRQDAPKVYAMNASIYFYQRDYLANTENPSPITNNSRVYVMDELSGVDIDREIDFKFVEFLVKEGLVKL
jgi:CMP-N,N'-diacetyllegionaminic acid synthase